MADRPRVLLALIEHQAAVVPPALQLVGSSDPLSARELHESYKKAYRQAYIYFAINDGKIARCSEQVA